MKSVLFALNSIEWVRTFLTSSSNHQIKGFHFYYLEIFFDLKGLSLSNANLEVDDVNDYLRQFDLRY
jgi:hypothetical protein